MMIKLEKIFLVSIYLLFTIIFCNFLINLFFNSSFLASINVNLYDIFSGLVLFIFLFFMGRAIQKYFKISNTSFSIVIYLFSFFLVDTIILFAYKDFSFNEVFVITNLLWILTLLLNKESRKYLLSGVTFYLFHNYFFEMNNTLLSKNLNILGDVEAVFFEQSKNIYENSYYFSVNNFVMEGYPQFISYFQSLFLKFSSIQGTYDFYSFTSHIVFYLSILFFLELNISKKKKIFLCSLFSVIIFNSSWLHFLFTTSLMSEGLVSLLTVITLYHVLRNLKNNNYELLFALTSYGLIYFSKQFNSFITVISVLIFYLIFKKINILIFGLSGLIFKELLYSFVFLSVKKDHHIRQIDVIDTFIDIVLFRDLKIENIIEILSNLWIDKPISLIFAIFYLSFLYLIIFNKNLELFKVSSFLIINLNFLMVFTLYVSVWQNMELESPIRYFLNYFHLMLVFIFISLEKEK